MFLRIIGLLTSLLLLRVTRQNALGYNNFMARVGVAVAPLILLLEGVWTALPQVIICLMPIACGLLALLLPETQGVQLPESIDDVEKQRLVESVRFLCLELKFDPVQQNKFHLPPSLHGSLTHLLPRLFSLALHSNPFDFLDLRVSSLDHLFNQIVSLLCCFQGDAGVGGERRRSGNLPGIQVR